MCFLLVTYLIQSIHPYPYSDLSAVSGTLWLAFRYWKHFFSHAISLTWKGTTSCGTGCPVRCIGNTSWLWNVYCMGSCLAYIHLPRKFQSTDFLGQRIDILPRIWFISDQHQINLTRSSVPGLANIFPVVSGALDEPIASYMVVHVQIYDFEWRFVFIFGKAIRVI